MKSGQFHNNLFKNKADDAHAICVGFVRKHLNRLGRPEPHIPDEAKKFHAFVMFRRIIVSKNRNSIN